MEEQIQQIISAIAQGDEQAQQIAASLVQAMQQQDESAMQVAQAIMERAQAGDQEAQVAAQMVQQVAEAMGGAQQQQAQAAQAQMARLGTKLNYIKYLRGECPKGYEMQMFKKGGAVCKKCIKKKEEGGEVMEAANGSVIDQFRCGRKMKKKEQGGQMEKNNKSIPQQSKDKLQNPGKKPMLACGGKSKKKVNKALIGANTLSFLGGTPTRRRTTNVGDMNGYLMDNPTREIYFDNGNIIVSNPDGSYSVRPQEGNAGLNYTIPVGHKRYSEFNDYFNSAYDQIPDEEFNTRGLMMESLENPDGMPLNEITVSPKPKPRFINKRIFNNSGKQSPTNNYIK